MTYSAAVERRRPRHRRSPNVLDRILRTPPLRVFDARRGQVHAKQHLWDVAKAIYGPGTDMADAGRRRDSTCVDYIRRNRHRMRYPAFRARGLCVGSGVLEAGCKNVVGTRFKRPGMHWSVAGVNAMACCVLSKRLDDFWIRRKARSAA